MNQRELAGYIDHTLLNPTATRRQVEQLCQEAKDYGFHSVCVNGRWVSLAADFLYRSRVAVSGVVSLPLGGDTTKIKMAQAQDAIYNGADEIDMVADLGSIVEGHSRYLSNQLRKMLKVCRSVKPWVVLKVIIESAALNEDQKIFASRVAQSVGVDFIKTSTGLHPAGGATPEDIKLIEEVAPRCRIKAAGGIRTAEQAVRMLSAGAHRIGTSAGVQIIEEYKAGL